MSGCFVSAISWSPSILSSIGVVYGQGFAHAGQIGVLGPLLGKPYWPESHRICRWVESELWQVLPVCNLSPSHGPPNCRFGTDGCPLGVLVVLGKVMCSSATFSIIELVLLWHLSHTSANYGAVMLCSTLESISSNLPWRSTVDQSSGNVIYTESQYQVCSGLLPQIICPKQQWHSPRYVKPFLQIWLYIVDLAATE